MHCVCVGINENSIVLTWCMYMYQVKASIHYGRYIQLAYQYQSIPCAHLSYVLIYLVMAASLRYVRHPE